MYPDIFNILTASKMSHSFIVKDKTFFCYVLDSSFQFLPVLNQNILMYLDILILQLNKIFEKTWILTAKYEFTEYVFQKYVLKVWTKPCSDIFFKYW